MKTFLSTISFYVNPLFILLFFFGCASAKFQDTVPTIELEEQAKGVKISKNLPPNNCQEVEVIFSSVGALGLFMEDMVKFIRIDLANKAAKIGANYVVMESLDNTTYKDSLIMAASASTYLCFVPKLEERSPLLFSQDRENEEEISN